MQKLDGLPFSGKTVPDIYLNIGHFLDHFIMLIFAKAAYDAGRKFGLGYDEIIAYGAFGFVLFIAQRIDPPRRHLAPAPWRASQINNPHPRFQKSVFVIKL